MPSLDEMITAATRHVTEGRRIVAKQRRRIAEGGAGADAVDLLKTFERSLEIFEAYLNRLLKERDAQFSDWDPSRE